MNLSAAALLQVMSLLVRASRHSRVAVNLEMEERNYSKQEQYFCAQARP